ncbi:hypothetical protein [Micromonospora sp. NPDC092111]|uniref:hypothetical protein n=1 Tax=Micromonospora sp. NPDC092111 TaxID=3364289 RepID=UPI0038181EEF
MGMFGYRFMQLVGVLPTLLLLLVALVLAGTARRRLPGRARPLLLAGATVLLLMELVSVVWLLALPDLVRSRVGSGGLRQFELLNLTVSAVQWIGYPIGLGMIVAAVFAGRAAPPAPVGGWGGWPPPATDPGTAPAAADPTATPWGGSDRPPVAPQQVTRPD